MNAVRFGAVCALLACVATPVTGQARIASGQRIAVDGRAMWIECTGSGAPTVILEAGHNESAATWDKVFPGIAKITRVCRYDRAGLGKSAPPAARELRTGRHAVADLHALLTATGERNAAVFVGHSLGGALARLYANAHPDRVAALVLLDAVHERESAAVGELLTAAQREAVAGMRPMSPEGLDIEAIFAELRGASKPLSIPVVVVARGRPLANDEMPPMWNAEQRRRREQLRRDLQAELARLSPAGRLVVATRSGHFVHQDEPDVVVEAIRGVVNQRRAGTGKP